MILRRTMDQQVIAIGRMACEDLSQLIRAREAELAEISKDLQEVQSELDTVINPMEKSHDV